MIFRLFWLTCVILPVLGHGQVRLESVRYPEKLEVFRIDTSPSPADWQSFLKSDGATRKKLWDYHRQRGKQLADWSWEWRLGWLKGCSIDSKPFCSQIFWAGLGDEAAVVRAEAASLLGKRFAGSAHYEVIRALVLSYDRQGNWDKGEPSFVHFRILAALKQIGGKTALAMGQKVSQKHVDTQNYWQKISQF